MTVKNVIEALEILAPPALQESYDNSGLLTGSADWTCNGILCSLDATEEIVQEAIERGCNMIVAHHPIIFSGLKKINGKNYVERTIIAAIKHDIAIYAIHTNLDNVQQGVSGYMAESLGLQNVRVLEPKRGSLRKLIVFTPESHAEQVRQALFAAGAGHIGNYSDCSFNSPGTGTFKAGSNTDPFIGEQGKLHQEPEIRIEVIVPSVSIAGVVHAMTAAHPYEEVAYDIIPVENEFTGFGSGVIGQLPEPVEAPAFLQKIKTVFGSGVVRHTAAPTKKISTVALCGGAGSFLISKALAKGADAYLTGDLKYHEFFDAEGKMLLADIGHYESEQFTIRLLHEFSLKKFPNFAVLKTGLNTNPVNYF